MDPDDLAIVVGLVLGAGLMIFNLRRRLRRDSLPLMNSPSGSERRKVGLYAWGLVMSTLLIGAALGAWIILNN